MEPADPLEQHCSDVTASISRPLGVGLVLRYFSGPVATTVLAVLVENALLVLIPLFIGWAIDGLLQGEHGALLELCLLMFGVLVLTVLRRVYDTRVYGTMRVWFGQELVRRNKELTVSQLNARLDMGHELVGFLEQQVPAVITASVQVVVSIAIFWHFDGRLGAMSMGTMVVLAAVYGAFHRRFYQLNAALNSVTEQQVQVLHI